MKGKRKTKSMLPLFIFLCVILLGIVAIGLKIRGKGDGKDVAVTDEELKEYIAKNNEEFHVDADEYYSNCGELQDTIPSEEAVAIQTETEAIANLSARGFTDYPITAEYTADGTITDAKEVGESGETHPCYKTYFISDTGEYWTIFVTMGSVVANPVGYNAESNPHGVQVVLAESEVVTCYDSTTNSFYETIPNESELIVKVVDHIDAETLNSLTVEGIEAL